MGWRPDKRLTKIISKQHRLAQNPREENLCGGFALHSTELRKQLFMEDGRKALGTDKPDIANQPAQTFLSQFYDPGRNFLGKCLVMLYKQKGWLIV